MLILSFVWCNKLLTFRSSSVIKKLVIVTSYLSPTSKKEEILVSLYLIFILNNDGAQEKYTKYYLRINQN